MSSKICPYHARTDSINSDLVPEPEIPCNAAHEPDDPVLRRRVCRRVIAGIKASAARGHDEEFILRVWRLAEVVECKIARANDRLELNIHYRVEACNWWWWVGVVCSVEVGVLCDACVCGDKVDSFLSLIRLFGC